MLDEFCRVCGYNRKYAIRKLNTACPIEINQKAGRHHTYTDIEIAHLKKIWLVTDQMCAIRLKAALPYWLKFYGCSDIIKQKLLKMSCATISRRLKPFRTIRGKSGTKPGSILKSQIPLKTLDSHISKPGFVEADTVAHCGNSLEGAFIWSLTLTDVHSGWTEIRAVWTKYWLGIKNQISDIQQNLPFDILGFSSDNGGEFLNHHLFDRFHKMGIALTRGRPYKKNDNAHVEQKNWTHVRSLFGYERFECKELLPLMNDLCKNEWSYLQNFFCPTLKLIKKTRIGAQIKKEYDSPKTPYQRILESDNVSDEKKKQLILTYKNLNPFKLKEQIERKLKYIFQTLKRYQTKYFTQSA